MPLSEPLTRAQADLAAAHVGVAEQIATWRARQTNGDYDELLSDALLGLLDAAVRWDRDRYPDFAKYAKTIVRFRMVDAYRLRNFGSRHRRFYVDSLDRSIGESLTLGEALAMNGHGDLVAQGADDDLLADNEPGDDTATAEHALGVLYGRTAEVARRVANGESMAAIADTYGVSESRICQIHAEAVGMMKLAVGIEERPVVLGRSWTDGQRRRAALMHRKGLPWFRIALAVGHAVSECKAELGVEVRQAETPTFA